MDVLPGAQCARNRASKISGGTKIFAPEGTVETNVKAWSVVFRLMASAIAITVSLSTLWLAQR